MPYQVSVFAGDAEHTVNCTGDCVTGDEVAFERATFHGSVRKPTFAGFELIKATVVRESYGAEKQQHTFTLEVEGGKTLLIKGRNLYANGVFRKPWIDEALRASVAADKHARGDAARATRRHRIEEPRDARF